MTRPLSIAALLGLAAAACTHAGRAGSANATRAQASAPVSAAAPAPGGMAGMCPMAVPGTKVAAVDTTSGEALTFTTTPDQAAALREKVHAMAQMHNRHHATGDAGHASMPGMGGGPGPGMRSEGGMQMPPPSQAAVEDLPEGARLLVTPNDPADLERLQATVRMHAEHMQQHGCGMMQRPQPGS
jgi:hypothetical protein